MTSSLDVHAEVAEPIGGARLSMSQYSGSYDLVRLAFKAGQLDGSQPFVEEFTISAGVNADALLPAEARVVRAAGSASARAVLAQTSTASVLLLLHPSDTLVAVASPSEVETERLIEDIRSRTPVGAPPDTVSVRTWYANGERTQSHVRDISAPLWADIHNNYPTRAATQLEKLVAMTAPLHAGKLILWHGPPGTGKTTALRAVMRAWAPWCDSQYIADPERFFALPGYIAEVIGQPNPMEPAIDDRDGPRWRLVIAEDCDEYLRATARRDAGAALGRLLNLADGVLGQGYDTLILLTTNEDIRRLHPALTRPGRCLAEVEFPNFTPHEARGWLPNDVTPPREPASLAELYSMTVNPAPIRPKLEMVQTGQYL